MSFGVTVADSSGNIVLDVADRVGTLVGVYTRTFNFLGGSFTDTITDSAFNNGTPFYIITKSPNVEGTGDLDIPSDITLILMGEAAYNRWFEDIFGWEDYTLSKQRWGVSAKYFQSFTKFEVGNYGDAQLSVLTADLKYLS